MERQDEGHRLTFSEDVLCRILFWLAAFFAKRAKLDEETMKEFEALRVHIFYGGQWK